MSADRLEELLALFEPFARRADPWPIHWVSGGDAGPDWCRPCCKAIAKHARRTREYPYATVDGGWDFRRESDTPSWCAGCGRLLGYSLSHYGLQEEIRHWLEDADPTRLSTDQAYEVQAVLDAAFDYGTEQEIADAVTIGERMAKLLPEQAGAA